MIDEIEMGDNGKQYFYAFLAFIPFRILFG